MPIYEYQCKNCGEKSEFLQKMSDEPALTCPNCQKNALTRLVSAAGFQLKGTGWYVTDFRDKNKPAPPEANKPKPTDDKPSKTTDNTKKETK